MTELVPSIRDGWRDELPLKGPMSGPQYFRGSPIPGTPITRCLCCAANPRHRRRGTSSSKNEIYLNWHPRHGVQEGFARPQRKSHFAYSWHLAAVLTLNHLLHWLKHALESSCPHLSSFPKFKLIRVGDREDQREEVTASLYFSVSIAMRFNFRILQGRETSQKVCALPKA